MKKLITKNLFSFENFRFNKTSFFAVLFFTFLIGTNNSKAQIAQRGNATYITGTTSATVNKPTGLQVGDLMLATINQADNDDASLANATRTGWTLAGGAKYYSNGNDEWWGTVLYKVATSTDVAASSFAFTGDSDSNNMQVSLIAFSGVNQNSPINVIGTFTSSSASNTSLSAGSITTTTNNAAVVMLAMISDNRTFSSWGATSPSSLTEIFDNPYDATLDMGVAGAWSIKQTAGETGNGNATLSGSARDGAILIALNEAPTCPASIDAGTTTASNSSVCPNTNVTLGLSGQTNNTLITYQWQQALVGTSTWTDISGANSSTLVRSITTEMQYRCRLSCDASRADSTPTTITIAGFINCYCVPTATTDDNTGITNVTFNTINNTTTGTAAYTNTILSTSVNRTLSYNLSVRVNTFGNYRNRIFAWVDWNQNGSFEEEEAYSLGDVVNQSNGLTPNSPLAIVVPENAILGTTKMRIRTFYVQTSTPPGILSPCSNWNYSEAEDYNIVVEAAPTLTWTGTSNTQWSNAANWSVNMVPNSQTPVTIPSTSNQPEVSGTNNFVGSVTVESGAVLTLNSNSGLQVTNEITVDEGGEFIVNDKANLGQVNPDAVNTGIVKIKRQSNPLIRLDYVLWCSPTQGTQTLKQLSPQTVDNRFYTYNSATNQYNAVSNVHTAFENGKGYLIRTPNNHTNTESIWNVEFQGTPNNGEIVQTLPNARSGNQNRYFLVGNPYASAINIQSFIEANEANITGITYLWRKTNGTNITAYAVVQKNANGNIVFTGNGKAQDPGSFIPSGQGFIVEMKQGASQVVFTNAMRVITEPGVFNRNAEENNSSSDNDAITLKLSQSNGEFTYSSLGYYENASNEFDASFDAEAIGGGALSIVSLVEDKRLMSQARGAFTPSDVVPLSIVVPTSGTYEISLNEINGIFQNQDIYIENLENGSFHLLNEGPYSFTIGSGTHDNLLKLVYVNATLSIDQPIVDNHKLEIAVKNQTVSIKTNGSNGISKVTVMDIQGKVIVDKSYSEVMELSIDVPNIRNQFALVRIQSQNGQVEFRKIMLN